MDGVTKGVRFESDGTYYKITNITKGRVYYKSDCDLAWGGYIPPDRGSISIADFIAYRTDHPECFDIEE